MLLTDDQVETVARQLVAIARWDEQLRAMLQPTPAVGDDGVWHRPTPGPKPPCSITVLDLLVDTEQRLRDYAGNLAEDVLGGRIHGADVTPREWARSRRTNPALCDFLRRHLDALASREWAPDAVDDIARIHRDLADRVEPPADLPVDAVATAADAARLTGIPAGTIRRWGSEGTIPKHLGPDGRARYRIGDIHQRLKGTP